MRSLRKLRGLALAAWILGALWFLGSSPAHALPQAPGGQPTNLSITADQSPDGKLVLSGSLVSQGNPVAGAKLVVAVDTQTVGQATTGKDGAWSVSVGMPNAGTHIASAIYAGDTTYRAAAASAKFTIADPTTAPPAPTQPDTTITATLTPSPVPAGSVLSVDGTVSAGGVPVDTARLDISCSFGGLTQIGVTDSKGAFSTTFSLPATGNPSSLTVTVSYAGDARFLGATATFKAGVTAAETPTPEPTPTISPEPSAPAVVDATAESSAAPVSSSATITPRRGPSPATTTGLALGIVALGAFSALTVIWVLAWRRHFLLPGERRGFGSDFGRPQRTV